MSVPRSQPAPAIAGGPARGRDPRAQVVQHRLADGDPVVAHAVARSTSRGRGTSTPRSLRTARRTAWMPRRRDVPRSRARRSRSQTVLSSTRCGSTAPARASTGARDVLRIRRDRLGDDRVVVLAQRAVERVEPEDDAEPGRLGVDAQADEIRPVALERGERLVDVTRPGARATVARGLLDAAREDVVEHDHARPVRDPLDVGEVAHDELGEVHPVDERERDAPAAERLERLLAVEVLVARLAEQLDVVAQLGPQLVERVDPDRAGRPRARGCRRGGSRSPGRSAGRAGRGAP